MTGSFGGWHKVAAKEEVERLVAVLARQSGQDCEAGRRLWGGENLTFCCSGGVLAKFSGKFYAWLPCQCTSIGGRYGDYNNYND